LFKPQGNDIVYRKFKFLSTIREHLQIEDPVHRAVDVACGTGLSTIALKPLATRILGIDIARDMIAFAPTDSGVGYIAGAADYLPIESADTDLMTVCSAFHWLRQEQFLSEARRVLRPNAWLVIYDNYFGGKMQENEMFHIWFEEKYLERFPTPPRNRTRFGAEEAAIEKFQVDAQEFYENDWQFTCKGLVDYLVTQSNVIAAVEGGKEQIGDVRAWLHGEIEPMYQSRSQSTFAFGGPIMYLKRAPS